MSLSEPSPGWTKKEMRRKANWDFTGCFHWPRGLQREVYLYELSRDSCGYEKTSVRPAFFHDRAAVQEWLTDKFPDIEEGRGGSSNQLIRIPAGADTHWLDDLYEVVTLGISLSDIVKPANDESLVRHFKRMLVEIRRKHRGASSGRPVSWRSRLANLGAYRLQAAGYDGSTSIVKKWFSTYAGHLGWKTGEYHNRSQGRIRFRGEEKWGQSCRAHLKLLQAETI